MTTKKHAPMTQFSQRDGELLIAGKTVSQVVQIAGQTPCYVYDKAVINANVERLRHHFPDISLHYAIKANPLPSLVSHVSTLVDGLDVASGQELALALASSTGADNLSFAGPGKSVKELTMALASGITINVESQTEIKRIIKLTEELDTDANIALRLNPDFELKSSGMKMGGGSQQFGIDVEQLSDTFDLLRDTRLQLKGLHIFTGSQNLRPESIISAHNNIFDLVERLIEQYKIDIQHLNIGGGFGIPYFPGDTELELEPIADNLKSLRQNYISKFGDCEFILELGRYLVGNAGIYLCEITDVKLSRGKRFLVTNGGLHHHLAASGNFGQVIRKNYPLAVVNKMDATEVEVVDVVGPLCTPLDILGSNIELPKATIGDLVGVYQSGAYGFSASPRDFLSHPHPIQLLL
ncbi:pyridoxal-dependent decarboxylase, exosortase A system-associated [Kangiella geojedonensis]|uniref:Pyridoxal-dependent decarboxylase n=2 Tax=Kangiella geojedonensis TaxID=914150 RepID=A0A0F6TNJ5_9GAMM|nr:pyridoxal-dependent decarboxylase, exosortase A system-associated [Kangiella geojedonensis]AKE51045.1 Pyridoxal-dependent decarboxylase [Kangiella geojedonensis]